MKDNDPDNITNSSAIKFGSFDPNPWKIVDLPVFCLMGVWGGLLGAFFVAGNYFFSKLRKVYVATKPRKVLEVIVVVCITATIVFFAPTFL